MKPKLVIALDTDIKKAKKIVNIAKNFGFEFFKIGHLLFDTTPEIIDYITSQNLKVILDLKFHDIPSVISKAISKLLENIKSLHSLYIPWAEKNF